MELSSAGVTATSGTLRATEGVVLRHAWTHEGVVAAPVTNGAQVLHLSVALCVLNDTYREAAELGVPLAGVSVAADGGFDEDWRSTGIVYEVTLDSTASPEAQAGLLARVDAVAEMPKVLRAGAEVRRG